MMHLNLHVLTQSKPLLIIAAIASRPYVQAAAGFDVIALDCFADQDTQQLTKQTYQVPLTNGCLDRTYLLQTIRHINKRLNVKGLCYGAGFEMQPELLSELAQEVNVIGNKESAVTHCKDPRRFFDTCDCLGIMSPPVLFSLPASAGGWLQKNIGASGGAHIQPFLAENITTVPTGVYFQQYQPGQSIACLFVASEKGVEILGFHQQWPDNDGAKVEMNHLYRYGGAATAANISDLAQKRFIDYVVKLARTIGLVGLNSCDAICDGDNIYVLEVNPRLSASVDLYAAVYPDLMAMHVDACLTQQLEVLPSHDIGQVSYAHQVVYAEADLIVEPDLTWPMWVMDIPEPASKISAGMPVCTVKASANSIEQAKSLVQARAIEMQRVFLN